ncbi:MAG: hypothetical protein J3R72DRAFT_492685 [Linnemannia gamsii]|nr:MAG: hypothetical protein J3R72DRAFT_492685 [Linnemannia gamsii]
MGPELGLHLIREPAEAFKSGSQRIAYEISTRTFSSLTMNDSVNGLMKGLPGTIDQAGSCFDSASGSDVVPATAVRQRQDSLKEYRRIEADVKLRGSSVPEDWELSRARYSVSRTDMSVTGVASIYLYSILPNRPFLMKAPFLMNATFAAGEIVASIEQFTDTEIRCVTQQYVNKGSSRAEGVGEGFAACLQFLRILGPYWKGAAGLCLLLERLPLVNNTKGRIPRQFTNR